MASRTSSTMICAKALTSSRKSWIPGTWNSAKSAWNSLAKGSDTQTKTGQTMTETTINAQQAASPEPELVRDVHEPKGVLRKNLKPFIYLGAALLVILAAVFSGTSKKTPSQQAAARHEPPQPTVQDNTDNNVQDLKNQLAAEQQRQAQQAGATGDPALVTATPAQQAAAARYSSTGQTVPCVPGQPCAQPNIYGQQTGQLSISPQEQEAQQLAAKERELAYNSRFASNLVYSHQPEAAVSQQTPAGVEVPTVGGYSQGLNPNAG